MKNLHLLLTCLMLTSVGFAQKIKLKKKDQLYVDKVYYGTLKVDETEEGNVVSLQDIDTVKVVEVRKKKMPSPIYYSDRGFEYIEVSFPTDSTKIGLKKEDLTWTRDDIIKFLAKYNVMSEGALSLEGVEEMRLDFPYEIPLEIKEMAIEEQRVFESDISIVERDYTKDIFVIFNKTIKKDMETFETHYNIIQDKKTIAKVIAEIAAEQIIGGSSDNFKPSTESDPKLYFYTLQGIPLGSLQVGKDGIFKSYLPFKEYSIEELNFNNPTDGLYERISKAIRWLINNGNL
ncbi:hypothetical protein ACFQ1M_13265 [Sungkyunkwania multivorans]|uniref:Uncharacterized protein n=1 Tax=Sungkyunkwania multivorans TaxID=1173618 RepID=A0ABW3D220_9FLAO